MDPPLVALTAKQLPSYFTWPLNVTLQRVHSDKKASFQGRNVGRIFKRSRHFGTINKMSYSKHVGR